LEALVFVFEKIQLFGVKWEKWKSVNPKPKRKSKNKIGRLDKKINQAVYKLYGLRPER